MSQRRYDNSFLAVFLRPYLPVEWLPHFFSLRFCCPFPVTLLNIQYPPSSLPFDHPFLFPLFRNTYLCHHHLLPPFATFYHLSPPSPPPLPFLQLRSFTPPFTSALPFSCHSAPSLCASLLLPLCAFSLRFPSVATLRLLSALLSTFKFSFLPRCFAS